MKKHNLALARDTFSDLLLNLNNLEEDITIAVHAAAQEYGKAGKKALQQAYLSTVPSARVGDYIYSSIGYRMVVPHVANSSIVWGGYGVYLIPEVEARFGKGKSDLSAPQIAYWIEHGITRFKSGKKKPASASWEHAKTFSPTLTTTARPFVYNAMITGDADINAAFSNKLDELIRW